MKRIVTMFLLAVLLMAAVNVNAQEEYTMLETLHQATYHDRFYMNPQALSSIGDPFILKEGGHLLLLCDRWIFWLLYVSDG